jgi:hypothetical protein
MRPFWLVLLVVATTTVGCSSVQRMDMRGVTKISLADSTKLSKVGEILEEEGEAILLIPANTALRLDVSAQLPMALLVPGKNLVRFTRDTYLYCSKKGALVSPDGRRWAALGDMSAIKELYGFSEGQLKIGFSASREAGSVFSVAVMAR